MPVIAVLLAAFNGEKYIEEQIKSILIQKDVLVHLYISVDFSRDATWDICQGFSANNVYILPYGSKYGSASANFFHLIESVKPGNYSAFAFADQDDIWLDNKLISAWILLQQKKSFAYSSNVQAFWESGREKKIIKSQPQRKFDYFFESPGPGCTFVMLPSLYESIRTHILQNPGFSVEHHDWWVYAWARHHGMTWVIDSRALTRYRQHGQNLVGANHGVRAKLRRIKLLLQGEFRRQVEEIAHACGCSDAQWKQMRSQLLGRPLQLRRKKTESLLMAGLLLVGLA